MKLHYYPDTDSLYIDLADRPSADSIEVASHVVVDLDDTGQITGIDIQHASRVVDLSTVNIAELPVASSSTPTEKGVTPVGGGRSR